MDPGYCILVVLRGGGRRNATRLLGEELLFINADGAVEKAVPEIRRALGLLAPSGRAPEAPPTVPQLDELVISFSEARIEESEGRRRVAGHFRVHHRPAQGPGSRSAVREFESPLGPIELEEIRWYLERYPGWPFGTFRERALKVEANLPEWGRQLYDRTLGASAKQTSAWRRATRHDRRVVVEVEDPGAEKGSAAALLALPWELLAAEQGYLFEGGLSARVVRRIPREDTKDPLPAGDRLRVLLVIARPEEEGVDFIDPRASARPLIDALAPLGHTAELEVLIDGTFPALEQALADADKIGRPFHVVHFDGHGIYDRDLGLGKLCFENPADARANKLERRAELIDADQLGELLLDRRVPLFVLDACQTAMTGEEINASVAARLLQTGVGSVLAMTHSVLVETARRFVGRFYESIASGERIGTAMVDAAHHLRDDPVRSDSGSKEEFHLQDWFVPVLFQEEEGDHPLVKAGTIVDRQDLDEQRKGREGELPASPDHGFVGRARELLTVQRRLRDERVLTLLGEGGQGKTALAIECARWLLDLRRFDRIVFASVEDLPDARLLLERLGRQLVRDYSVATAEGTGTPEERLRKARLPAERVLLERRVLLVVDNLESVLPTAGEPDPPGLDELLQLLAGFAQIGETRLLLTSRGALPAPLGGPSMRLGRLSKTEGRELVAGVLARMGREPAGDADERWIDELIERVDGHARSLVLLAPHVAERGLRVTAESVARIMADLERRYPGKRELSLLASVRLSLDRLPEPARQQVRALAVFHGATHAVSLAHVLEVEADEALELCRQLVALGLADAQGAYLLPDPALGPAVADELSEEERRGMEQRWLRAELDLINTLYQMQFRDPKAASEGTQAALRNLLAAVEKAEGSVETAGLPADAVMNAVVGLQILVRSLGRPAVLSLLEEMRRRLEGRLGEWSNARFVSTATEIEELVLRGDVTGAVRAAERLRERADAAGDAYPDAEYDRAMARYLLCNVLLAAGRAADAQPHLDEAEKRFGELANAGSDRAARMVGVVATKRGDALRYLGRLQQAAASYESSIEIAERTGDARGAAVDRGQLGTVRLLQRRLGEALGAYQQAMQTFEDLREPAMVATAWHQIGRVHEDARQWDRAEAAYQSSLRIEVELGNKSGQAGTLDQLGLLYQQSDRLEESVQLHRQAATHYEDLGDSFNQGSALNNLAQSLVNLGRLDEAREAATQAAKLKEPFGHSAEPWKTWAILYDIETLAGRPDEAAAARSRAMELYAAYRREGGEQQSATARAIGAVGQTLLASGAEEARRQIPPPERFVKELLPVRDALLAIVDGARDPALAQDPQLDPESAVELSLLLESLAGAGD